MGFVYYLNAGLLARSQYESGRSCNRPTGSRVFAFLFAPTANAPLILKIKDALRASHADIPKLNSKFSLTRSPPDVTKLFAKILPSKHKSANLMCNFFPLLHTPSSPLPITVTFSLTSGLSRLHTTLTKRTSRRGLDTFRLGHCCVSPS